MCKFDNQYIVEELKKELGFGWHVYPVNIYASKLKKQKGGKQYIGDIYCVHCKSKKLFEVHNNSFITIHGKTSEWVLKCSNCNRYMTVEHDINA